MAKKSMHLPWELIIEILLRLPVKTLVRCKCVSKLWLSLISDPHFATSHFQLAASCTHRLVFLESTDSRKTLTIDFEAWLRGDSAASLRLDFLRPESEPEIGGSCRGFLFLHHRRDFYLWNPSTGVYKQIPRPPIIATSKDHICGLLYGFAYDPSTDDYLVVLGSYEYDDIFDRGSTSTNLDIFSLRANKWEHIEGGSHLPHMIYSTSEYSRSRVGSFLNGAIHWLIFNHETSKNVIIAFDLKERKMSEIALPDDCDGDYNLIEYHLLVLDGVITAWMVEFYAVKMWVMQEYGVHSSWTKTLDFSNRPCPEFSPICFTNCGDILGSDGSGGLLKFNDEGRMLDYQYYGNIYLERDKIAVYTESLLSLPDGTEYAYEDD